MDIYVTISREGKAPSTFSLSRVRNIVQLLLWLITYINSSKWFFHSFSLHEANRRARINLAPTHLLSAPRTRFLYKSSFSFGPIPTYMCLAPCRWQVIRPSLNDRVKSERILWDPTHPAERSQAAFHSRLYGFNRDMGIFFSCFGRQFQQKSKMSSTKTNSVKSEKEPASHVRPRGVGLRALIK